MNRKMNSKLSAWLPFFIGAALVAGMFLGYRMRDGMPGRNFLSIDKAHPLQEVMELIQQKYVDEIPEKSLNDTAIGSLLGKLDPHSVFIPAEELQNINEDIAGVFFGIGIEFNIIDDTINVISVVPKGPSEKAGVITGDKLIKVNDSAVAGVKVSNDKIRKLLRGTPDSKVTLHLLRNNEKKAIEVTRGMIPVSSVDAAYMIEPGTGFIRLNKFSQVTYKEFMQALQELKTKGLQKLILDLRGNGGGVLDEATSIADEFLDGEKLITYTEGTHFPKKEYRCKKEGLFEKGQLIVLSDEGTASASEILIGALQDWDRATILGRRSFGKGLVQEQYDLSDGSALRLTVARYYTPVGRSIQRPYNHGEKAYYNEISNRFHDGETLSRDSIRNDTSKVFKTSKGKIIYGGGGITPDVFVAIDTNSNGLLDTRIYMTGVLSDFAYKYYLDHKIPLLTYKNSQDFGANFKIGDNDWAVFSNMARKDSINIPPISAAAKKNIELKLKAGIARQLWRNEGFFEVLNLEDNTVKRALEVLKN